MSLHDALMIDLDELAAQLEERKADIAARCDDDLSELRGVREQLAQGKALDEVRMKLRAIRHRQFGTDDPRRDKALKAQDMRVRMRAPTEAISAAPQKVEKGSKAGLSRVVVQGTITRELGTIESRMVSLMVDEKQSKATPEICFLADLRAGLVALQRELPEHDVLLALVNEHLEGVGATLRDIAAGGMARARRFFEHDRELLGRLKAMVRAEGEKSPGAAAVEKLTASLNRARKYLGEENGNPLKASMHVEHTLVSIHKELTTLGFVAARSLFFSALNRPSSSPPLATTPPATTPSQP